MLNSSPASVPPSAPMGSTEIEPIGHDYTAALADGESLLSGTFELYDLTTESFYPTGLLATAPGGGPANFIVGNVVSQWVANLVAGHTYRLFSTVIILPSLRQLSLGTVLTCNF